MPSFKMGVDPLSGKTTGSASLETRPLRAPGFVAVGAMIFLVSIVSILLVIRFVDHPLATIIFNKRIHGALFQFMPREISDVSLFAAFLLFAAFVWIRVSSLSIWIKAISLSLASAAIAYTGTAWLLKPFFGRSGPMLWVWHNTDVFHFFSSDGASSYFFPSGHTAFVTALMSSLALTLPEFRAISGAVTLLTVLVVVVLELHFLSDALAGIVVGAVAALIVRWAARRFASKFL
jgi:membrane-associated phospholipid phosphatase